MRTSFILSAAIIFCALGSAQTACGAGTYAQVQYPPSTASDELQIGVTYTIWIPDGVKQLRGVIVHQHGAGTIASKEGSTASYDLHWQALAKKWDCALLGPSYHVTNEKTDITPGGSELWFDPRRGSDMVFLKGLADLAAKTAHPELTTVPWCLWGHSGGGIWSDVMATLHPERVAAIWLRSGSAIMFLTHTEFKRPDVPAAMYSIPMMANPGVKEKPAWMNKPGGGDKLSPEAKVQGPWAGNIATFKEYRAKGAPIGFAPDPRSGHECADSRYLAIPFFDACLAMRLPAKGSKDQTLRPVNMSEAWLAPFPDGEAQPAKAYKGNPSEAVWLPNEAVAKAWMEYVKTGAVGDTTPPPAPTNVRVAAKDDKTEVTWEAEADFESGLRCFIVLRDGQELAQVPKTPVGKYGRPLFQSMTYHDTPSKPMPEMRYVDASAKAGAKHEYAVIAVNSVGLKSAPAGNAGGGKAAALAIPEAILLWEKGAPRATGDSLEDKPAIYPYLPDAAKNTGAAVLVCPGGGNQTRCCDSEGVLIAQWFKERGIAAFILRYRIAPLYTAAEARLDTQRGVQFLRAHADKFKIAPDRIGVIGFSAGAANVCATTFNPLAGTPDAPDPIERVSSSPNFLIPVYGSAAVPATTNAPLPPTFMFCTAEDGGINGMVNMYTTLLKRGVPTEVHFFEKGPHGTTFAIGDPVLGEWPNLLFNWIRLKGFLTGEKRVPLDGIVKVDGEPLARGIVVFHPVDKVGAAPVVGYIFNSTPGRPRGEYRVAAGVGAVPGKYRVEVRQESLTWLSIFNNPMVAKFPLLKTGTDAQKKEVADYARARNLEPSIENQRIYAKIHPGDAQAIYIEVKEKGDNRFDIGVFSK